MTRLANDSTAASRRRRLGTRAFAGQTSVFTALLFVAAVAVPPPARAATPESLEVRTMVAKGMKWLDTATDNRLGAKALIGLCYIKHGDGETHPQIQMAADACKAAVGPGNDGALRGNPDIYSTGLAIVFLCELNPSKYQHEINAMLKSLQARQKPNGGWGYPNKPTGDTSMTQYGVLASWEAKKHGFVVPPESIEAVCLWLIRTQDPSGGWGYQGREGEDGANGEIVLVKQDPVRQGLSAAGLGSTYVCSDLLGITSTTEDDSNVGLPPALKPVHDDANAKLNQAPVGKISPRQLKQTAERGRGWWREHYKISVKDFPYYYLYALKRCQSFYESVAGLHVRNPGWYDDGVGWLHKRQQPDGHWESGKDMSVPDTAFAILFLLRSTKKSIEKSKGFDAGVAVGGEGLPRHLDEVRLDGGKVLAKPVSGSTDVLLGILADPASPDFHDLAADPRDVIAQILEEQPPERAGHLARLRRLAAEGTSATRLAAVRVLSQVRDVMNVPSLIAALSDTDWQTVYQADQGLRLFSRRVSPDQLTEAPDEKSRAAAIADWKRWYASISPSEDAAPRHAAESAKQ